MATFLELQNTVFRIMRDVDKTKYDLTFIMQWLNDAERIYCNKTNYVVEGDTSILASAGVKEYSQPVDCKSIIQVYVNGSPIYKTSYQNTIEQTQSNGDPSLYYVRNKYIGLYPVPTNADNITIIYYALGGGMVNDTDEPIIPIEHQHALVDYACYKCATEGDDTRLNVFYTSWTIALGESKTDAIHKAYSDAWPGVLDEDEIVLDPINHLVW